MSVNTTIIIPVYNGEKFIKRAIDSVLPLTDVASILILDNCSTDGTKELCRAYEQITYIGSDILMPMFDNFNRGLDIVSTEFFTFLCVDDQLIDSGIRDSISILEANKDLGAVFGLNLSIDNSFSYVFPLGLSGLKGNGHMLVLKWFYMSYIFGINIYPYPSGVLFRKQNLISNKFDTAIGPPADIDYFFQKFLNSNVSFTDNLNAKISIRVDQASSVFKKDFSFIRSQDELLNKYIDIFSVRQKYILNRLNAASHIANIVIRNRRFNGFFKYYSSIDFFFLILKLLCIPYRTYLKMKGVILFYAIYNRKCR